MANEKFAKLLQGLKAETEKGVLLWKDLPDEEMFRCHIAGGLVRIGRISSTDKDAYTLSIINRVGSVVNEFEVQKGEESYSLIQEVYNLARSQSRDGQQLLDSMLQILQVK